MYLLAVMQWLAIECCAFGVAPLVGIHAELYFPFTIPLFFNEAIAMTFT